jgi:hypothetical protein
MRRVFGTEITYFLLLLLTKCLKNSSPALTSRKKFSNFLSPRREFSFFFVLNFSALFSVEFRERA